MTIKAKIEKLFPETEKVKAVASITLDDSYAVHGVKIVETENGILVGMPSRKSNDKFYDIFHPISKDARSILADLVIAEYEFARQNENKTSAK